MKISKDIAIKSYCFITQITKLKVIFVYISCHFCAELCNPSLDSEIPMHQNEEQDLLKSDLFNTTDQENTFLFDLLGLIDTLDIFDAFYTFNPSSFLEKIAANDAEEEQIKKNKDTQITEKFIYKHTDPRKMCLQYKEKNESNFKNILSNERDYQHQENTDLQNVYHWLCELDSKFFITSETCEDFLLQSIIFFFYAITDEKFPCDIVFSGGKDCEWTYSKKHLRDEILDDLIIDLTSYSDHECPISKACEWIESKSDVLIPFHDKFVILCITMIKKCLFKLIAKKGTIIEKIYFRLSICDSKTCDSQYGKSLIERCIMDYMRNIDDFWVVFELYKGFLEGQSQDHTFEKIFIEILKKICSKIMAETCEKCKFKGFSPGDVYDFLTEFAKSLNSSSYVKSIEEIIKTKSIIACKLLAIKLYKNMLMDMLEMLKKDDETSLFLKGIN